MTNEYGVTLDRNGYAPSIMQKDLTRCWTCKSQDEKLDRHEIFGGAYRAKSKRYGLWVMLCHDFCHLNGVHKWKDTERLYRRGGQIIAMAHYGWTIDEFINLFGKNYLSKEDCEECLPLGRDQWEYFFKEIKNA